MLLHLSGDEQGFVPNLKIKRARVVVDDAGVKRLADCGSCGEEKYIVEGQKVCDECRAHSKRKRKATT